MRHGLETLAPRTGTSGRCATNARFTGDRRIEHAYLTIIAWPEGLDRSGRARLIARASGWDLPDAERAAIRDAPTMAAMIPADRAEAAVAECERAGVPAMAPTERSLASTAPPVPLRGMKPTGDGRYIADLWNAPAALLDPAKDLLMLVRATVKTSSTTISQPETTSLGGMAYFSPEAAVVSGAINAARAARGPTKSGSARNTTEMLDLWLRDGRTKLLRRFRVVAHRFDATELFPGERRAITGREEADRLALRLAELAPGAMVDTGFAKFRPPPTVVTRHSLRGGAVQVVDQIPAFDFYSPWRWLIHQRMTTPG